MPNPYWIKVYFDKDTKPASFSPDRQVEEEGSAFRNALKKARDCKAYAVCLCTRGKELPLAIRLRNDNHSLAKYPNIGKEHVMDCRFYSRLNPEGGQKTYTDKALSESNSGIVKITLDYPLQTRTTEIEQDKVIDDEIPRRPYRNVKKRNTMSLLGLLHTLWETAGYNIWVPGMDGKRNSPQLGYNLFRQAEKIQSNGILLSEVLMTPARRGTKDEARNKNVLQSAIEKKRRLVVVSELAQFSDERKHGTGRLPVQNFAGMPFLNIDDTRWKSALQRFSIEARAWAAGFKIFAIAVTDVPGPASATVRQVGLMMVSDRFIPLDSTYESVVEKLLYENKRTFIKPLVYDSAESEYLPDFCLTDVTAGDSQPFPIEVWGMKTAEYLAHKEVKTEWYNKEFGRFGWWSWDAAHDPQGVTIRPFPPAERDVMNEIMK